MLKIFFLVLAGMAFAGSASAADNTVVIVSSATGAYSPAPPPPGRLVTIFSNMGGKYPKAVYACCNGYGIAGPSDLYGNHLIWDAMAFTPSADHTVTRVELGLGYGVGTNEAVVGLYTDNGGVPGTALKTWRLKDMPAAGSCCAITMAGDKAGIPVTEGQQYWIVVRTDFTNKDAYYFWDVNTTDQVDGIPFAQYCSADAGGDPCSTTNDTWVPQGVAKPAPAFAVLGTN